MRSIHMTVTQTFWVWENCIMRCAGCGNMIKAGCGNSGLVLCNHVGDGTTPEIPHNEHAPYPYAKLKKGEACMHPQYIQDPRMSVYGPDGSRLKYIPPTAELIEKGQVRAVRTM